MSRGAAGKFWSADLVPGMVPGMVPGTARNFRKTFRHSATTPLEHDRISQGVTRSKICAGRCSMGGVAGRRREVLECRYDG